MSDPRLTQTNYFGRNDRGAQIGHLENFFNFSMHGGLSGSEYGNDADVEDRKYHGNRIACLACI